MPPRAALGYLSLPLLVTLIKSDFASLEKANFDETLALLKSKSPAYAPNQPDNLALCLAKELHGKVPMIYSTNNLLPVVANRWKCQIAENAKTLSFYNVFPELDHNEIVGWQFPSRRLKDFQIIYLRDKSDFSRNQSRMEISKQVLESFTNQIIEVHSEGESPLARLFSLIYLGDMVSFYLAILNDVDPTPIKKIQQLKDELTKIK
jgi:glucose/mannose-6-phosphate isomerase